MAKPASVPVLIIAYDRPQHTKELLKALGLVRPSRLFLACDGWLDDGSNRSQVLAVRQTLTEKISWDASVEMLFQQKHLGCREGVVTAIDWFFSQVDSGIVLEDDCVPHPDFFSLSARFLEEYGAQREVWGFTGDNSARLRPADSGPFGFTSYALVWGWASWASRWEHYDRHLERFRKAERPWRNLLERAAFEDILNSIVTTGQPDTWDYQWSWTVLSAQGVWGFPRNNLIRNIGFDPRGTHTKKPGRRGNVKTAGLELIDSALPAPRKRKTIDTQLLMRVHSAHKKAFGATRNRER